MQTKNHTVNDPFLMAHSGTQIIPQCGTLPNGNNTYGKRGKSAFAKSINKSFQHVRLLANLISILPIFHKYILLILRQNTFGKFSTPKGVEMCLP